MLGLFDCLDLGDDNARTSVKRPADGGVVGAGDSVVKTISLGIESRACIHTSQTGSSFRRS